MKFSTRALVIVQLFGSRNALSQDLRFFRRPNPELGGEYATAPLMRRQCFGPVTLSEVRAQTRG